jgi:hypothetical protein
MFHLGSQFIFEKVKDLLRYRFSRRAVADIALELVLILGNL